MADQNPNDPQRDRNQGGGAGDRPDDLTRGGRTDQGGDMGRDRQQGERNNPGQQNNPGQNNPSQQNR